MNSETLFARAKKHIPGGVNSPVRSFNGVGGTPPFIKRGAGAYIYDEDDRKYIDYVGSWGPLILGHAHPSIIQAIKEAAENGTSFGASTAIEVAMAELICQLIPSIEMVRMVNSGTEATMTAIRLARGYTGRDKILKFIGCYHGHADSLLVKAGSGLLTLGIPSCPGVPADLVQHTLTVNFNDLAAVEKIFEQYGEQIAAIIIEPVACNMNCILPAPGFLQSLRTICDRYGSVLIFDEVITGFRLGLDGAQGLFNVRPDLTTLGKIIGGGLPVGAFGGSKEIMQHMAPIGSVYQAGTLSGNPLAMAAGYAMLQALMQPGIYPELKRKTNLLTEGLLASAKAAGVALQIQQVESVFGLFFTDEKNIMDYPTVARCDTQKFAQFFHGMLQEGIYLAPSAFEAGFISLAHTELDIQNTISAAAKVMQQLKD